MESSRKLKNSCGSIVKPGMEALSRPFSQAQSEKRALPPSPKRNLAIRNDRGPIAFFRLSAQHLRELYYRGHKRNPEAASKAQIRLRIHCQYRGRGIGYSVPMHDAFARSVNASSSIVDFRPMRVSLDGALHDGRGTPTVNCFRQEHQVGRFLSIFEERLTRRAYLRTHGQPTR
jgi:hypothetical protein